MKYDLPQTTQFRTDAERYQELVTKNGRTAPEDTELASLATSLADYMIKASDWNAMETSVTNVNTTLSTHTSNTSHIPFVVTTGSANAYLAARNPALTSYVAGAALSVQINVTNTGASTINVNGLGAKSIVDSKGSAMIAGKLRLNSVYTLRYNGTAFMLQGEGGDYGTATASDILAGKSIGTDTGLVDGTMIDRAGDTAAISSTTSGATLKLRASAGYRDGTNDFVTITDSDFIADNIRNGVNLFGLMGTLVEGLKSASGSMSISGNYSITGIGFPPKFLAVWATDDSYRAIGIEGSLIGKTAGTVYGFRDWGGAYSSSPSLTFLSGQANGIPGQSSTKTINWYAAG